MFLSKIVFFVFNLYRHLFRVLFYLLLAGGVIFFILFSYEALITTLKYLPEDITLLEALQQDPQFALTIIEFILLILGGSFGARSLAKLFLKYQEENKQYPSVVQSSIQMFLISITTISIVGIAGMLFEDTEGLFGSTNIDVFNSLSIGMAFGFLVAFFTVPLSSFLIVKSIKKLSQYQVENSDILKKQMKKYLIINVCVLLSTLFFVGVSVANTPLF